LCNLGSTLVAQGDVDTAIGHFRAAIKLRPDLAVAHNNLGNALRLKGDKAGALECFREAVRLDPASAEAQSNLGRMLLDHGEPQEALRHCQEAVRLRADLPAARNNLGNVLHVLGRLHEAKTCFHEAIRLKPGLAAAHVGVAGALEELGDIDQSVASLREALRHDPQHAGALARLATRLRAKLPDDDRATIERLLADPDLVGERRWLLQFGLAHVVDAMGEFDRAARLTIEANFLQSADFRRRGLAYDPEVHQRLVGQIIAAFTPEFFARVSGFGLETEKPVFIVGMPRSGTTRTEQVLASHPRVFGAGETRLVRETWDALPAATGHADAPLDCLQHLDRQAARHLAGRHLGALEALDLSADRIVDRSGLRGDGG